MQSWQIADLSLAQLVKAARSIDRNACERNTSVAVLGEGATENYAAALAAALKLRGCWPDLYDAPFSQIHQEILDSESGLARHAPAFVILFHAVQVLQDRWAGADSKTDFVETVASEITGHWDRLLEREGTTVLQQNYCLPLERPFGNYSSACRDSFPHAVRSINELLFAEAATRQGVAILDTEYQASYYGRREWLCERFWCQARQALAPKFLPPLVKSISDVILARLGALTKCVVLDLDNTLWSGILGDDGIDGIVLGDSGVGLAFQRFQRTLAQLKERGVLLAVCSKNRQELAEEAFRTHPEMALREGDVVAFVANFDDKVTNILKIRKMLDLGLDSFVFLDDSPFERDLVRTALPAVQVPEMPEDPAEFLAALGRWNLFEAVDFTAEDVERAGMYKANVQRAGLRETFHDLDSYLADLGMVAEVAPFDRYALPRVAQLVQRSNQFNLTTVRHSDAKLAELAASDRHATFVIRLLDRLGDNGIVVCVIAEEDGDDLVVDTWVMSCRVIGRKLEEVAASLLVEEARARGCRRVVGQYKKTAKNSMVADLYLRLGFAEVEPAGETLRFAVAVDAYEQPSPSIEVRRKETVTS